VKAFARLLFVAATAALGCEPSANPIAVGVGGGGGGTAGGPSQSPVGGSSANAEASSSGARTQLGCTVDDLGAHVEHGDAAGSEQAVVTPARVDVCGKRYSSGVAALYGALGDDFSFGRAATPCLFAEQRGACP